MKNSLTGPLRRRVLATMTVALSGAAVVTGAYLSQRAPQAQAQAPAPKSPMPGSNEIRQAYGRLPLSFEANNGQTSAEVDYLARGAGYALFLTPKEAVFVLRDGKAALPPSRREVAEADSKSPKPSVLRMQFVGANPHPATKTRSKLPGKVNYLIGNDPSKWRVDVPEFAQVEYSAVWPGIDLKYYGNQGQLEYDFDVAPGADPSKIRMLFQGASKLKTNDTGDLIAELGTGEVVQPKPVVYQELDGRRELVACSYEVSGNEVAFDLGAYDASRRLVIDPSLTYGTYLGGSAEDAAYGIGVDSSGDVYACGYTYSTNFPSPLGYDAVKDGSTAVEDAYVIKFDPTLTTRIFNTFLGGTMGDRAHSLALDNSVSPPRVCVTGYTRSTNFPTLSAAQGSSTGNADAFVTKLENTGSSLVFSTYLGGSQNDLGEGIATDASGQVYVGGRTASSNFKISSVAQNCVDRTWNGDSDAFATKLTASGALTWSTYIGGSKTEKGWAIAVDSSENVYLTGETNSGSGIAPLFPTTGGYSGTYAGSIDVFMTKINSSGASLDYSRFFGGGNEDIAYGIAVDSTGRAYVTGHTLSTNFPSTAGTAYQTVLAGGANVDAFVTVFDTTASNTLVYSSYFGGTSLDEGFGISLDDANRAFICGVTRSTHATHAFPVKRAFQEEHAGGVTDGFIAHFDPYAASGAASLIYSTYIGGASGDDVMREVAWIPTVGGRAVCVVGDTKSASFPFDGSPTFQGAKAGSPANGQCDAIVARLDLNTRPKAVIAGGNQSKACAGTDGTSFDLDGTGSYDPDEVAGEPDSIVSYEWYKDAELVPFATGATTSVSIGWGVTSITLKVTDTFGATGTAMITLTVTDVVAPTFSPALTTLEVFTDEGECFATLTPTAPAVDNCDPSVTVSGVHRDPTSTVVPLNGEYDYGTNTITWTATDDAGNSTVVVQTVNVLDNQPPTMTPPDDVVTPADDENGAVLSLLELGIDDGLGGLGYTATDGCDPVVDVYAFRDNPGLADTGDPADLAGQYPLGLSVITWLAVDHDINFTVAFQTVYVEGATSVTSAFTSDDEDWTVYGADVTGAMHSPVDGNPDGYIYASQPTASSNLWYFEAPSAYHGNKEAAFDQVLSFDLKIDGAADVSSDLGVIIVGGGLQIYAPLGSPPTTSWATKALFLNTTGGWKIDDGDGNLGNDVAATDADILTTLGSVTSLKIGGKFRSAAGAQTSLDNAVLNLNYTSTP